MALERWIALAFLCICCVYGYAAFFTMDGDLPPFMRRNPIWPSTFPKVLAVLGALTSLVILLGLEKATGPEKTPDIDYRRLQDYKLGQALGLIALMVAYARCCVRSAFSARRRRFLRAAG
jgi:putative tricarboxylic transport membrane protein